MGTEPDHRADVYALAVLVFELATATSLYEDGHPSTVLQRTLNDQPPSACARNPSVPPDVDGVLRRAMARDPRRRHGSALELIDELTSPPPADGARADARPRPEARAEAPAGEVDIDSLIDVLSGVLDADRDGREPSR
jgi:serine/threonine-protein kinase